jgi:hypothetical protein
MSNSRRSYASRRRLLSTIKVAALIAGLGLVTVMLEQPPLTASPNPPRASVEQRMHATDSGAPQKSPGPSLEQKIYATDSGDAPLNSRSEPAAPLDTSSLSPEQKMYSTDSGDAPLNSRTEPAISVYFAGRFTLPQGEAEPQPPTF